MPPAAAASPPRAFVITAPGLETLALAELHALGVQGASAEPGGVEISGDARSIQLANLHLRTASRVVLRVGEFTATAFHELERRALRLPWGELLPSRQPVRIRVTCRKSRLYHSDAVAERVAGAIARRAEGVTTSDRGAGEGDEEGADPGAQLVLVRLLHDRCTISLDSSGALLHLRGYRQALAKAPLRETLAAACLLGSGWNGSAPLEDPMCGAGTIPIEAALLARRIPPGLGRAFAFERWSAFDASSWRELREQAQAAVLPGSPVPIRGSDRDAGAIEAALGNAERAGVAADVVFERRALSAMPAAEAGGWIVTNPPYGMRVGEQAPLRDLYARFGDVVRESRPDWTVAMLSADRKLEGHTRLRWHEALRTSNGGIPVRLMVAKVAGD